MTLRGGYIITAYPGKYTEILNGTLSYLGLWLLNYEENMGLIAEYWSVLLTAAQAAETLAELEAEEYLLFQKSVSP